MNKPKLSTEPLPSKLPLGPATRAGVLHEISAGMRTFRPVIDTEKCVKCLQCFLCCPDGVIDKSGDVLEIDYDYCKGCGICKNVCSVDAITMIKEEDA
jgi:pyruvate ferredoxin oxidoreductase delta subunit